ncbi:MAG: hypothetical protein LBB26_00040 [Puniceicoccales bacterium]|jgi:hypothetical protein|nr:hypothetical protein [Puniceicoccales bacterium]
MKNATIIHTFPRDIFNGDWGLQMFPALGLPPDFKREPSFLREFPTFLERASPLPAAKAVGKMSSLVRGGKAHKFKFPDLLPEQQEPIITQFIVSPETCKLECKKNIHSAAQKFNRFSMPKSLQGWGKIYFEAQLNFFKLRHCKEAAVLP